MQILFGNKFGWKICCDYLLHTGYRFLTSLDITQMISDHWTSWPNSELQWPGTATAGYRSHKGRVTAADTLQQPPVSGGSSLVIRRRSHQPTQGTDTLVRYLPYSWTALCEKNWPRCSSRMNTAHISHITPAVQLFTRQCHCHVAHYTIPFISSYPHTHMSTDLPDNVDFRVRFAPDCGKLSCNNFDSLTLLNLFCVAYGTILCQLNNTD